MPENEKDSGNGPKPWQPKRLNIQQRTALLASALGLSVEEAAKTADYHAGHVYKLLQLPFQELYWPKEQCTPQPPP